MINLSLDSQRRLRPDNASHPCTHHNGKNKAGRHFHADSWFTLVLF
jgi:hypothetical protein